MRSIAGITCLVLLLAAPARAQDASARAAEAREIEAALAKIEAAIAKLEPIVTPPTVSYGLAQFDVRFLHWQPADRSAPRLEVPLASTGYRTGRGAGGSFSFDEEAEDEGVVLDPDELETMATHTLAERAWDDPASIDIHRGYLIVNQTELGRARIAALLDQLLDERQRSIQMEVGFYALPADLQREVELGALQADGALSPALLERLDRAVAANPAWLAGSAMLTALNGQRVYLHQGPERAFVSAYQRTAGGTDRTVETVDEPVVSVLRTGLALDARATLLGDARRRIALDVRFVRSRLTAMGRRATPWGDIDAPQVTMDSVRTSAHIEPGGGVLVFSARASQDPTQPDVTIVVRPRVIDAK